MSEKIDQDIAEFGRLGFDPLTLVEGPDPNYPPAGPGLELFNLCGSGVSCASVLCILGLAAMRGWRDLQS